MPVLPAHGLWFLFTCQLISQLPGIICIFLRLASINWSLWTIWPTCWAFFKPTLHDKAVSQHCGCLVTQSCQILCKPKDCSMPGFPCPLLSSRVCPNSCPLSRWRHPTVSSSVAPLSSCPQSFPKSGSFPKSWLFTSCGQSIGASASAALLPMNIQGWFLRIDWFDFLAVQGTLKRSLAPRFKSIKFGGCSSRSRFPWNSHNYSNFISRIKGPLFQLLLLLPHHSWSKFHPLLWTWVSSWAGTAQQWTIDSTVDGDRTHTKQGWKSTKTDCLTIAFNEKESSSLAECHLLNWRNMLSSMKYLNSVFLFHVGNMTFKTTSGKHIDNFMLPWTSCDLLNNHVLNLQPKRSSEKFKNKLVLRKQMWG